jgi:pilus assembly protein Flp/PilA
MGKAWIEAFLNMVRDRSGAAAAEYALVLAILGAALTFGALALGTAITDSVDSGAECTSATVSASAAC